MRDSSTYTDGYVLHDVNSHTHGCVQHQPHYTLSLLAVVEEGEIDVLINSNLNDEYSALDCEV